MNTLAELMEKVSTDREAAEDKLKEICNKSSRLSYDSLIEKLLEITEHSMHVNYFKFTTFIQWLADDLDYFKTVNNEAWDMTIEEIDEKFNDEYWESLYNKCSEDDGKGDLYKSVEEFKGIMVDWMCTHCLDSAMYELEREYKHRKSKGMI